MEDIVSYFESAPEGRRSDAYTVHNLLVEALPGVAPVMRWGMPVWETENGQYVGFAVRKAHFSLHVSDTDLVEKYRSELGKTDCGKGCIRFKSAKDLNADALHTLMAALTAI